MTRLLSALGNAIDELPPAADSPPRFLVAFSGGPDSTALLWGLTRLRGSRGFDLIAAHLDHGLDADSARRAQHASGLAIRLEVPCHVERRSVRSLKRPGESLESAARRVRYRFLSEVAERERAQWIFTAHQRDDQAETVLLRMLFGSGWQGLAAIAVRRGRIVRPLLGLSAADLRTAVEEAGLRPNVDPTNQDLLRPRNRIRHQLLPALETEIPDAARHLAALAKSARRARRSLDQALARRLDLVRREDYVSVPLGALRDLPSEVRRAALAMIARHCGRSLPPSASSFMELERQLTAGSMLGVDCGGGWSWSSRDARLYLEKARPEIRDFQYTVRVPGELEIPEVGMRMRLRRAALEPWMTQGRRQRVALNLSLRPGDRLIVRNRRAGDRIRPLGAPGQRRLKEVLIDRKVPKRERGLLPLLLWRDRIAWVPGVTIDEAFRLTPGAPIWVAELEESGISPLPGLLDEQTER